MKKLLASSIGLYLVFGMTQAFADNSARIKELTEEGQKLVSQMNAEKAQYEKDMSEKQIRVIEINGILKEFSAKEEKKNK